MIKIAIVNDTRKTNHFGCRLVMHNLISLLKEQKVEIVWTWPVSVDWRKYKRKLLAKSKVDAIIVNGEGTIHHNNERKFSQALVEFAKFSAETLQTPCYLINSTLYKNTPAAYDLLQYYRAVYVRDKESLQELNVYSGTGRYVPDLTFARNSYKYSASEAPANKTLVIDSAVKSDNLQLKAYAEEHGYDFRSMIVARPENARFIRSPRPYIKNVYRWIKSEHRLSTDPSDYIGYLRGYSMVVTGRYHTVTMCLKNRIPFVAIESNTPKIQFLLEDVFGQSERSLPVSSLKNLELNHYKVYSDDDQRMVEQFISEAESEIDQMLEQILADIRKNKGTDKEYLYS